MAAKTTITLQCTQAWNASPAPTPPRRGRRRLHRARLDAWTVSLEPRDDLERYLVKHTVNVSLLELVSEQEERLETLLARTRSGESAVADPDALGFQDTAEAESLRRTRWRAIGTTPAASSRRCGSVTGSRIRRRKEESGAGSHPVVDSTSEADLLRRPSVR